MSPAPHYPWTNTPIQVGDEVLWQRDSLGTVVFIISQDLWRADFIDGKDWYIEKYGEGIMDETVAAGLVLEPEVEPPIELASRPMST